MLLVLLLTATFLAVFCDPKCFFDIERLRCWCRNEDDQTIFRITHEKNKSGKWSVNFNVTDEECDCSDITQLLPPSWTQNGTNGTEGGGPSPPPTVNPEWIQKGYQLIGSSLYKLHSYGTYWDKARRTCIHEGAHLAIINSETEADLLSVLLEISISSIQHVESSDSVFIGFHDTFEEGEYLTVFGVPLRKTGFNFWAPNKPDNRRGNPEGFPGNDCGGLTKNGKLIDLGCDWFHAFICEIEFSDIPAPMDIDYSKSLFSGIEMAKLPGPGRNNPRKPGFGYKLSPGFSFYRYHTTSLIWNEARLWCEREGAYLAVPDTPQELEAMNQVIFKIPQELLVGKFKKRYTLTGFHGLFEDRTFVTIFNETIPLDKTLVKLNNHWASEQYVGENCGSVDEYGLLNDVDCHLLNPFICEKDALK